MTIIIFMSILLLLATALTITFSGTSCGIPVPSVVYVHFDRGMDGGCGLLYVFADSEVIQALEQEKASLLADR